MNIITQSVKPLHVQLRKTALACLWMVSLVATGLFAAEQWQPVAGNAIDTLLSGRHVVYEGDTKASQTFHAGGSTTYIEGRPSLGRWRVSDNQYCSQWPPSGTWDCYDLFKDSTGTRIRFTSASGDEWIATFDQ